MRISKRFSRNSPEVPVQLSVFMVCLPVSGMTFSSSSILLYHGFVIFCINFTVVFCFLTGSGFLVGAGWSHNLKIIIFK